MIAAIDLIDGNSWFSRLPEGPDRCSRFRMAGGDVVTGTRFHGEAQQVHLFRHRAGWRVFELSVSYAGRDYAEGKKIGLR